MSTQFRRNLWFLLPSWCMEWDRKGCTSSRGMGGPANLGSLLFHLGWPWDIKSISCSYTHSYLVATRPGTYHQTLVEKIPQLWAHVKPTINGRRPTIFFDHVKDLPLVFDLVVRGNPVEELHCQDSQRPDIYFVIVVPLIPNNFWSLQNHVKKIEGIFMNHICTMRMEGRVRLVC